MSSFVQYSLDQGIATIVLDDGKRNALSPAMIAAINAALDRAEADRAMVVLTGRAEVFSAGFDLKVMKAGGLPALRMLGSGFALSARLMAHPYPVVAACSGHALAMGVFLLLSADYVLGTRGPFRIAANEVAIGLTMPRVAVAVLRQRLRPADFQRAVTLSEAYSTEDAVTAGFFDELVSAEELMPRARDRAARFAELDAWAHRTSKRRIRGATIRQIRRSIPLDLWDAVRLALRRRRS